MSIDIESRASPRRRSSHPAKAAPTLQPTSPTPAPPALPGRRSPKWVALGVVALCLGALLSYVIYAKVADESAVISVVNTVRRGETVGAQDVAVIKLGASTGIQMVPAAQLDDVVGQQAVYDLVGGSLLPVGAVADVVVPKAGRAVVGVRLISGRAPAGELPAASPLRLVSIPPSGADPKFTDQYTGRTIIVRVINQVDSADGTSVLINVDVAAAEAPVVALLAAQERLAAVRDADR